jgi:hypothetical protein
VIFGWGDFESQIREIKKDGLELVIATEAAPSLSRAILSQH